MQKSYRITILAAIFLFAGIWFATSNSKRSFSDVSIMTVPHFASKCTEQNGLPDPRCTPGSINPDVTQSNIKSTICSMGYTKTIRPPLSYTQALKIQQIHYYGYINTSLHDYEEDHLIPLELGGSPTDPKNLWPEPGASPNDKDNIESICNQKVCSEQIALLQAQKEIATDWRKACQ